MALGKPAPCEGALKRLGRRKRAVLKLGAIGAVVVVMAAIAVVVRYGSTDAGAQRARTVDSRPVSVSGGDFKPPVRGRKCTRQARASTDPNQSVSCLVNRARRLRGLGDLVVLSLLDGASVKQVDEIFLHPAADKAAVAARGVSNRKTLHPSRALLSSPASGVVHDVRQGESIADVVGVASEGDTVVVHAGSYPQVVLSRRFDVPVRIVAATGEAVTVGGFVVSGGSGYVITGMRTNGESRLEDAAHDVVFDRMRCAIPERDTRSSCFYFRSSSYNATLSNSYAKGGWDGVKFYGCDSSPWPHHITVIGNEITRAHEDLIHVDCANHVVIKNNLLRDPVDNDDHNDGVQTQASNDLRIVGNTFSFRSGSDPDGPDQAMMLGNVPARWPDRSVTNTLVANNLVHHWNGGRALIMNGTVNTRIANNTFRRGPQASDETPSIIVDHQGSVGGQNPGLEIWDNVLDSVYYADGAAPRQGLVCVKGFRKRGSTSGKRAPIEINCLARPSELNSVPPSP